MERTSIWDGKVVKLKPFKGDWLGYWDRLSGFWSNIGDCRRECPRLVLALDAESKRINATAPKKPFFPAMPNFESAKAFLILPTLNTFPMKIVRFSRGSKMKTKSTLWLIRHTHFVL